MACHAGEYGFANAPHTAALRKPGKSSCHPHRVDTRLTDCSLLNLSNSSLELYLTTLSKKSEQAILTTSLQRWNFRQDALNVANY